MPQRLGGRVEDVEHDRPHHCRMNDRNHRAAVVVALGQVTEPVGDPREYVVLGLATRSGGVRPPAPGPAPPRGGGPPILPPPPPPFPLLPGPPPGGRGPRKTQGPRRAP